MTLPAGIKHTQNDEWILVEGDTGTVGISDYAQNQLSDVVYVEITVSIGDQVSQGDTCATIESVKAAADVYMPVSGTIIAVNEAVSATPEVINNDPYGAAWLIKVRLSDPAELDTLLEPDAYELKLQAES